MNKPLTQEDAEKLAAITNKLDSLARSLSYNESKAHASAKWILEEAAQRIYQPVVAWKREREQQRESDIQACWLGCRRER